MSTNLTWLIFIGVCFVVGGWLGKHNKPDASTSVESIIDEEIEAARQREDEDSYFRGSWDPSSIYYPMQHSTNLFDDD